MQVLIQVMGSPYVVELMRTYECYFDIFLTQEILEMLSQHRGIALTENFFSECTQFFGIFYLLSVGLTEKG